MKKFSELKVGDMLHIYYKDFISKKITKIDRDEKRNDYIYAI